MEVYVAFIDDEDGDAPESWCVYYTPFVLGKSRDEAERLAKKYIEKEYPYEDKEIYIDGPHTVGVV